jgi:low affinity Fe/Cu permease
MTSRPLPEQTAALALIGMTRVEPPDPHLHPHPTWASSLQSKGTMRKSQRGQSMKLHFHAASHKTARWVGSAISLAVFTAGTAFWVGVGYFKRFPDDWFLVTNIAATVTIFLVLLLLRHSRTQNMKAIHTKIDELIRSSNAGNHLIASERLPEKSLEEFRAVHKRLAEDDAG